MLDNFGYLFVFNYNYFYCVLDNIHKFDKNVILLALIAILILLIFQKTFFRNMLNFVILLFFLLQRGFLEIPYEYLDIFKFNDKLLNGLFNIHPLVLYFSLSLSACAFYYFFFFRYRLLIFFERIFFYFFLAMILGAWWAFQELTWGGWWNWDFVELLNLIYFFIFMVSHRFFFFKKFNFMFFFFLLFFFFFFFLVNRYSVVASVHNFAQVDLSSLFYFYFVLFLFLFYFLKFVLERVCFKCNFKSYTDYYFLFFLYMFAFVLFFFIKMFYTDFNLVYFSKFSFFIFFILYVSFIFKTNFHFSPLFITVVDSLVNSVLFFNKNFSVLLHFFFFMTFFFFFNFEVPVFGIYYFNEMFTNFTSSFFSVKPSQQVYYHQLLYVTWFKICFIFSENFTLRLNNFNFFENFIGLNNLNFYSPFYLLEYSCYYFILIFFLFFFSFFLYFIKKKFNFFF